MISLISEGLTNRLVMKEIIRREDIEVYQFGIECFMMKACHIITYLLIAICFHKTLELLIFLIGFIPLRVYAGGYHANTSTKCYIVSCIAVLSAMCLIWLTPTYMMGYSFILALIVSLVLVIIVPVETINKPLDETEKTHYRRKAYLIIGIELGIILIFRMILWNYFSFIITLSLTYEMGIAVIGKGYSSQIKPLTT